MSAGRVLVDRMLVWVRVLSEYGWLLVVGVVHGCWHSFVGDGCSCWLLGGL